MSENQVDSQTAPFRLNDKLPTQFIEATMIASRADDIVFFRLFCLVPEAYIEQTRFIMTKASVKAFVDGICAQTNYYPTQPAPGQSEKK